MIDANNITKTYFKNTRKENKVLSNASIEFPDTGFVFIVGRSGSGKSTILNAIGGLISYEGEILYDKKKVDIEKYRRKNIGYIFQDFLLFDELSVRDNIKITLNLAGIYDEEEISRRVSLLLKAVGLNINASRRASALSLGQRQRVAIARTLAANPHVILADEPTGNLDSKNSLVVMDILAKLSVNHLVICVTHNANLVNLYADEAYSIVDKKFTRIDPRDEKLEESYSTPKSEIDIGDMTVKDYKDDNFILRLYSSSSKDKKDKTELKIVKKDGKILIIGDNISISSSGEVVLEDKKDETPTENKAIKREAIDLDFDNTKVEKKTFRDSAFYGKISEYFSFKKMKKSSAFVKAISIILPLIVFILVEIGMGVYKNGTTYSTYPWSHTDNLVVLYRASTVEERDEDVNISHDDMKKIMTDEESGIIDTSKTNPFIDSGALYGEASYNSSTVLYLNYFDESYDIVGGPSSYNTNQSYSTYFADISAYSKIPSFSDLTAYTDLKDNEIVIDRKIFEVEKTAGNGYISQVSTLKTSSGKNFIDSLVGTYLNIPYSSTNNKSQYMKYKIVGISDDSSDIIFSNKKTSEMMRTLFYKQSEFGLSNSVFIYPDNFATDYEFVNYSDVKSDSAYRIVISDIENYGTTSLDGILSKSAKAVYSEFVNTYSGDYIEKVADPDKKIICFYNKDSHDKFISSYAIYSALIKGKTEIPSNITYLAGKAPSSSAGVIVPYGLFNVLYPNYLSQFDESDLGYFKVNGQKNIEIQGVYQSDDPFDTIYTDPLFLNNYHNTSYDNLDNIKVKYDSDGWSSQKAYMFSSGNYFVTTDVEKTKAYFEKNTDFKLTCYSYNDLYQSTKATDSLSTVMPYIVSVSVLLAIFLGVALLDSISEVNRNKRKIGVLRCLGKSKASIIYEYFIDTSIKSVMLTFLPWLFAFFVMKIFYLDSLGFGYFLLAYLCMFVVNLISTMIPLLFILAKKPIDIIRSLS